MLRVLALSSFLVLGTLSWATLQQKPAKPAGTAEEPPVVTLKGRVIDLGCWLAEGELAGEHAECAVTCLQNGATAGFRTADTTYVVLRDPMLSQGGPELARHANQDAVVTAHVFSRGGLDGIQILSLE